MYVIFSHVWLIFMVHVGKYTVHGWYGKYCSQIFVPEIPLQMTKCHHVLSTQHEPLSLGENPHNNYQLTGATIFSHHQFHDQYTSRVTPCGVLLWWNLLSYQPVEIFWCNKKWSKQNMRNAPNPGPRDPTPEVWVSESIIGEWRMETFRFSWTCLPHRIHGTNCKPTFTIQSAKWILCRYGIEVVADLSTAFENHDHLGPFLTFLPFRCGHLPVRVTTRMT